MLKQRTLLSIGFLGTIALCPLGCSKDESTIDLGENVGGKLTDYAAHWEGYAEAYTFSDGTDHVRLTLAGDGHGTLRVGELALFPPPTDPNVGYPPGRASDVLTSLSLIDYPRLGPGFEYSVLQTQVQDNRIQLGVNINELYSAWCQLQTPILDTNSSPSAYRCSHNWGFSTDSTKSVCVQTNPDTEEQVSMVCSKLFMCLDAQFCACTATNCTAAPVTGSPSVRIDGALEQAGAQLVGTLVIDSGTRVNIRLTRK